MCKKCEEYAGQFHEKDAEALLMAIVKASTQMETIARDHLAQPPLSGLVDGLIEEINEGTVRAFFRGDVIGASRIMGHEILKAFYVGYYTGLAKGELHYFSCEDHDHNHSHERPKQEQAPIGHSMKDFDPKEFGL